MENPGDYHLQPREQQQMERLVPLHQAKIHLAFRADIEYDGSAYKNGAVALSEHVVTLAQRGLIMGRNLKRIVSIHVYDILGVRTISDYTVVISVPQTAIQITSSAAMRFTRNLLRNFILSAPMLPAQLRFAFQCHDSKFFPPFNPPLSPSQQFQFTYNANCSYFDTTYYHDIPRYFHSLIATGNSIFDLSQLPISILETGFGEPADIRPLASSLMFCPFIDGFVCHNTINFDILKSVATVIFANQNLKIVRLVDTGATSGCTEIAKAMLQSEVSDVVYWDLSDNDLIDIRAFTSALSKYQTEVLSIKLDRCSMDEIAVNSLFGSLCDNENLWSIKQISLLGSKIGKEGLDLLYEFLEDLSESEEKNLSVLRVGPIEGPKDLLQSLKNFPIVELSLFDTIFNAEDEEALKDLVGTSKTLEKLSLDKCTVPDLVPLFKAMGENVNLAEISLGLGGIRFGDGFANVIRGIVDHLSLKLVGLELNDAKLSVEDLHFLNMSFSSLKSLKELSVSRNFSSKMKGIGNSLVDILKCESIEKLSIAGSDKYSLQEEAIPLICALYPNTNLQYLDISDNEIGNIGLSCLRNLVITSQALSGVKIDGSNPTDSLELENFIHSAASSPKFVDVEFPIEDVYNLVEDLSKEEKKAKIQAFSQLQSNLQQNLQSNRAVVGIHSDLAFINDSVLDKLIDDATIDLHDKLGNTKVNEHLAITNIVGLPMPFEEEWSAQNNVSSSPDDEVPENITDPKFAYASQLMFSTVSANMSSVEESMKTLQFNSLCIRRPDSTQRMAEKGQLFKIGDAKLGDESKFEAPEEAPKPEPTDLEQVVDESREADK